MNYVIPVKSVKVGTILIPDNGFDCMECDKPLTVQQNEKNELFVPCLSGEHLLEGQKNYHVDCSSRDEYVGFILGKGEMG